MFRTEILIDGETYRTVRGNRELAIQFAREIAADHGIESTGTVDQLNEALLDDERLAWADIAFPVTSFDYPTCPQCDLMGSFSTGENNCSWCEACGYDSHDED